MAELKRAKRDLFSWPLVGFIFKNPTFILTLRLVLLGLFVYAVAFGFIIDSKENAFTAGLFWGLFWPFFMILSLATLGRVFCGICPHAFIGKYITRYGQGKKMPSWLNPYSGLAIVLVGYWFVIYAFPGMLKAGFATALFFSLLTLVAIVVFWRYGGMAHCKSTCPIGSITRAFGKVGATWLTTYKGECQSCKSFTCAKVCPYNEQPYNFDKRGSMGDCTLCMECASACDAVAFRLEKPAHSLWGRIKRPKNSDIWTYILLFAAATMTMQFHHALGRTAIADQLPWVKSAAFVSENYGNMGLDLVGVFAFGYGLVITLALSLGGLFVASRLLKLPFKEGFTHLGFGFAPLMIIGGLSHILAFFFYHYAHDIANGFIQAFALPFDEVKPLATRRDAWVRVFEIFPFVAAIFGFVLMAARIRMIEASRFKKLFAFIAASAIIFFYVGVVVFKFYAFATWGAQRGGHSHKQSAQHGMFQSVPTKQAVLLGEGEGHDKCHACGMPLAQFYKTNHAIHRVEGSVHQVCSMHCLVDTMRKGEIPQSAIGRIEVVDTDGLGFIDVLDAHYVIGSQKFGTMSAISKYAFASRKQAKLFHRRFGGEIVNFKVALKRASMDFK